MDPEHVTIEDLIHHKWFCLTMPASRPIRIIHLRASASLGKQEELCESCDINIARQRGPLGSETSIWACLTASNHEIHKILSCDQPYSSMDLRIRYVGCHELLGQPSLIPKMCFNKTL